MIPKSARFLLRSAWNSTKDQAFMAVLALVVLPTLWQVPADVAYDWLIPEESRSGGAVPVLLDIAMLFATSAWGCLLWGGQLLIAIDVARGKPVRFQRFLVGLRYAPRLLVTMVAFGPIVALIYVPSGERSAWVALSIVLVAVIGTAVLVARTLVWAPMIVDSGRSVLDSLWASWQATSHRTWMVIRLGAIMLVAALPLVLVEATVSDEYFVTTGLCGAIFTLAAAHSYDSVATHTASPTAE